MKSLMTTVMALSIVGSTLVASAQSKFPLRVEIDVSTKRSKQNIGAGKEGEAKLEQVQVRAKIKKTSSQPWEHPVSAELYVIGKQIQTGNYGIIDVQKGEFKFTKENDNTFEYASPMYTLGKTTGNINVGGQYETYLIVVSDHEGNIVDTKSGRPIGEKGIAFIRELGPKTMFDKDGNVIGKLEEPGKAFKQAIPAAVHPGDNDDD